MGVEYQPAVVVRAGEAVEGRQGVGYFPGVSAQNVGAQAICAHVVTIPPGGRARAHLHAGHESVIYVLEGEVVTWFGDGLRHRALTGAGEFLYIPAGTPHLPVNLDPNRPARGLVARTDPNEQESVVLLPELDALPHVQVPPQGPVP